MSKKQMIGISMIVLCLILFIVYFWLYIIGYGMYLVFILVTLGFSSALIFIIWIGYVMATTPDSSIDTLIPDQDESSL